MRRLIFLTVFAHFLTTAAQACSTFHFQNEQGSFVGKNEDIRSDVAFVFVNPRGLQKTAFLFDGWTGPLSWSSRYGSVTFNHLGREMPSGGMNEQGLVIEVMQLNESKSPAVNAALPVIDEHQWIQYQLDTAATLSELLKQAQMIRVGEAHSHYFACDVSGACAVLEYQDGKLLTYAGASLKTEALTNHFYAQSCEQLTQYQKWGGKKELPVGSSSLERFTRLADSLSASKTSSLGSTATSKELFSLLHSVEQNITAWTAVYDQKNKTVQFKTRNQKFSTSANYALLDLKKLSFECTQPTLMADMVGNGVERKSRLKGKKWSEKPFSPDFKNYSSTTNLALITHDDHFNRDPMSKELIARLSAYPDTIRCKGALDGQASAH